MKKLLQTGSCLGVALTLAACADRADPVKALLPLTECRVANMDTAVLCGTLQVAENRATREGRRIGINVIVIPATAKAKLPDPVFLFAGGPGQATSDLAREAMAMLGGLNNRRDIVLVDQRGTGKSNGLKCKLGDPRSAEMLDPAKREALSRKLLNECREALSQRADLSLYTTTIAMADIDEVRVALGYRQINLWGGSYGTRAAMEYLRRYPEQVRAVVLDGVAPPSLALPVNFARDAGAAYDKMLAACEQQTVCAKQFPDLRGKVEALLKGLEKNPRRVPLADPLTGVTREISVSRDLVLMAVFSTLYVPEMAAQLPAAFAAAADGDYASLLALSSLFGDFAEDKIAMGMRLSVACAEDVPRIDRAGVGDAGRGQAPFGALFVREFIKSCDGWPKGAMPADFTEPVKSAKPVLLLSGGLDPVTPPVFGEEVRKSLSNALHLVAPNIGHGVTGHGCSTRLVKKFIETASVAELDGACLSKLPRPLFYQPLRDREPDQAANADQTADKSREKKQDQKQEKGEGK